jgi:hypothetical protein
MEQREYEDLVDMFQTPGWKYFMKGTTELEDAIVKAAPDGALTNDQWQYARGEIRQLRSVIGYESYIKHGYEEQEAYLKSVAEEEAAVDANLI